MLQMILVFSFILKMKSPLTKALMLRGSYPAGGAIERYSNPECSSSHPFMSSERPGAGLEKVGPWGHAFGDLPCSHTKTPSTLIYYGYGKAGEHVPATVTVMSVTSLIIWV